MMSFLLEKDGAVVESSVNGTEPLRYGCGTELGTDFSQRYGTVRYGVNSVNGTDFG